jgi:hypothetical protein
LPCAEDLNNVPENLVPPQERDSDRVAITRRLVCAGSPQETLGRSQCYGKWWIATVTKLNHKDLLHLTIRSSLYKISVSTLFWWIALNLVFVAIQV